MTDSDRGSHQPLVSVVLNSYNTDRYISGQIQSILDQTYTHLELIVCDDCSTDRTAEIVREFMQKDPRVKWLQNEHNLRAYGRAGATSRTFQRGFESSQGEFIATSDADDFWLPEKIKIGVDYLLSHPEVDLVFTDSIVSSEDLSEKLGSFQERLGNLAAKPFVSMNALLKRNIVPGHVVLFRRNVLPGAIPLADCFSHDNWTALVAALNHPLGYLPERTVLYRQHGGNVTGANERNLSFYVGMLSDGAFLKDHFENKAGQIIGYKRLLTLKGSEAARRALSEKIQNQTALLTVMQAPNFFTFIYRLLKAAWTILGTKQKYHLSQWGYLALSWRGIRKLKLSNLTP
jgi:glycosyltransferase involved in cell wall biosynthesis